MISQKTRSRTNKYLSFVEKNVKIGPADPEVIGRQEIIKKINASKTYSPFGKFDERAKLG